MRGPGDCGDLTQIQLRAGFDAGTQKVFTLATGFIPSALGSGPVSYPNDELNKEACVPPPSLPPLPRPRPRGWPRGCRFQSVNTHRASFRAEHGLLPPPAHAATRLIPRGGLLVLCHPHGGVNADHRADDFGNKCHLEQKPPFSFRGRWSRGQEANCCRRRRRRRRPAAAGAGFTAYGARPSRPGQDGENAQWIPVA